MHRAKCVETANMIFQLICRVQENLHFTASYTTSANLIKTFIEATLGKHLLLHGGKLMMIYAGEIQI